jgi:hypothetical protein
VSSDPLGVNRIVDTLFPSSRLFGELIAKFSHLCNLFSYFGTRVAAQFF